MYKRSSSRCVVRNIVNKAYMKKKSCGRTISSCKRGLAKLNGGCKRLDVFNFKVGCCIGCEVRCCSGKTVVQNYRNFSKSAEPSRFMFFSNGVWKDYHVDLLHDMILAFHRGTPTVEVTRDGRGYLVDFLRMVEVDLRAGVQRSVAWIDKNGKCYFPKFVMEEEDGNVCNGLNLHSSDSNGSYNMDFPITHELPTPTSHAPDLALRMFKRPELVPMKSENEDPNLNLSPVQFKVIIDDALKSINADTSYPRRSESLPPSETCPMNGIERSSSCRSEPLPFIETSAKNGIERSSSCEGNDALGHNNDALGHDDGGLDVTLKLGLHQFSSPKDDCIMKSLGNRLSKLENNNDEYRAVHKSFLSGLSKFASATTVTSIYKNSHKHAMGQTRLAAFQAHLRITRSARGNANVRNAWHGASKKSLSAIISHGFDTVNGDKLSLHGNGVYFAAEDCSYLSAAFSDCDENGEQHVLLCRVILGNVEEVPNGSKLCHPSSEKYDSGVDNISNPKLYIVWSTHMNTHIVPEYVVSFKVLPYVKECWSKLRSGQSPYDLSENSSGANGQFEFGSYSSSSTLTEKTSSHNIHEKHSKGMHVSPLMSFQRLFSVIRKSLPGVYMNLLERVYADYRGGKVGKDALIKEVRVIAGDKLLMSAIQSIQKTTESGSFNKEGVTKKQFSSDSDSGKLTKKRTQGGHSKVLNGVDNVPHSFFPVRKSFENGSCSSGEVQVNWTDSSNQK